MTEKSTFEILGWVRCAAKVFPDVPSEGLPATLEMRQDLEPAIEGLFPGVYIYVITEFHHANSNILTASPGAPQQRGAFALRGSDRPNRIGMTLTRIERIRGTNIDVNWIDFSDGTPIFDIKRYNPRWECVFSTPRDDRRHFEKQITRESLVKVLQRPIECFAGLDAPESHILAKVAAELIQDHDLFLGDPNIKAFVRGAGTLVDCVQGLLGARFGDGRLSVEIQPTKKIGGDITLALDSRNWHIVLDANHYNLQIVNHDNND
jgi:tRNA (Thr-GGU) A37 N-methylase